MPTLEITDEGLRELVDDIKVRCERCGKDADKVMRCRRFHVSAVTVCTACIQFLADQIDAAARAGKHVHCAWCGEHGARLYDLVEIFDL